MLYVTWNHEIEIETEGVYCIQVTEYNMAVYLHVSRTNLYYLDVIYIKIYISVTFFLLIILNFINSNRRGNKFRKTPSRDDRLPESEVSGYNLHYQILKNQKIFKNFQKYKTLVKIPFFGPGSCVNPLALSFSSYFVTLNGLA